MFRENRDTYHVQYIVLRKSWHLWDKVEKYCIIRQAADDDIIWRMHLACWISKATDTHSEYIILIYFLQLQWLQESSSILRYTCIACPVTNPNSVNFVFSRNYLICFTPCHFTLRSQNIFTSRFQKPSNIGYSLKWGGGIVIINVY
jgi:hypothetical protein